jgi:hypothetical protein
MSAHSTAKRLSIMAILAVHAAFAAGCAANDPREQASTPAAPPAPAVAPQNATATAAAQPKSAVTATDGTQVRCVYQPVTGSRVRQKTCRTEAEWKQLTVEGQQAVRDLQKPIAQGVEGG